MKNSCHFTEFIDLRTHTDISSSRPNILTSVYGHWPQLLFLSQNPWLSSNMLHDIAHSQKRVRKNTFSNMARTPNRRIFHPVTSLVIAFQDKIMRLVRAFITLSRAYAYYIVYYILSCLMSVLYCLVYVFATLLCTI